MQTLFDLLVSWPIFSVGNPSKYQFLKLLQRTLKKKDELKHSYNISLWTISNYLAVEIDDSDVHRCVASPIRIWYLTMCFSTWFWSYNMAIQTGSLSINVPCTRTLENSVSSWITEVQRQQIENLSISWSVSPDKLALPFAEGLLWLRPYEKVWCWNIHHYHHPLRYPVVGFGWVSKVCELPCEEETSYCSNCEDEAVPHPMGKSRV